MILQRLYELALREGLMDDRAFEPLPVPYYVVVGVGGEYVGIEGRRADPPKPGKRGKGKEVPTPRAHGNAANQGFARCFVDTLPRVLPVVVEEKDREKFARSRATFWAQIARAAEESKDPALADIRAFGQRLEADKELHRRVLADVAAREPDAGDRCAFRWQPDGGETLLDRPAVRDWFRRFFEAETARQLAERGGSGVCQITGEVGPIPRSHSVKLAGVPGGLPTGVSLVSFDKAAFCSYGLDGAANAAVGEAAADGYGRALQALAARRLRNSPPSSLRLGDALFLFWTRDGGVTPVGYLDTAEPGEAVSALLAAVKADEATAATAEPDQFYLLVLSGNAARAIVRGYLEMPLPAALRNLGRWFADLRIAAANKKLHGDPTSHFPLGQLAAATAPRFKSDDIAPEVPGLLLRAALEGGPLPDSLLSACLRRLQAEGGEGIRASRFALVKIILKRGGTPVSDTLDEQNSTPAYVCGRLLCVLEDIQFQALGEVNASVVDKYFGTFGTSPALLFSRLMDGAQHHFRKMRTGGKKKACAALQRRLTDINDLMKVPPPGQLSLKERGLFALGYYHEKARGYERRAAAKRAKAEREEAARAAAAAK